MEAQNDLTSFLGNTINVLTNMTRVRLKKIFDGSDSSMAELYTLIKDCGAQNAALPAGASADAAEPILEQALWLYMIPIAWARATGGGVVSFRSHREFES